MSVLSVRDVQHRLAAVLDEVERGREFTVSRRGKVIARIVPAQDAARPAEWPDFEARMNRRFPDGPPGGLPASEIIRGLREERF